MTIFFTMLILIIVGISVAWMRLRQYSKQLFIRAWEHEKFLISIYYDCNDSVKHKIEKHIIAIKPL